MPVYVKVLLVCILCITFITGIVMLVKRLFG
jgi:hypothetical protein